LEQENKALKSFENLAKRVMNIDTNTKSSNFGKPLKPHYLTARYEQLSRIHPKVGLGSTSCNAFLLTKNEITYVITACHTLVSEHMSATEYKLPNEVRLGGNTLGPMAYSRFFDVAIFKTPEGMEETGYTHYNDSDNLEDCIAHFRDINSDIHFTHTANYTNNINRKTRTGVFFYQLMEGSSGSAITKNGNLVGMVSGSDEKYNNLTVCIPSKTIIDLIHIVEEYVDFDINENFDLDNTEIYPNMLTAPIPTSLRSYFPKNDLTHLIIYTEKDLKYKKNRRILPLTMIESNVANKALDWENWDEEETTNFKILQMNDTIRKRWFAFPRKLYGHVVGNSFWFSQSIIAKKKDFITKEFDNICFDGMNVLIGEDKYFQQIFIGEEKFKQPEQINKTELKEQKAEIFPLSSAYSRFYNGRTKIGKKYLSRTKNSIPLTFLETRVITNIKKLDGTNVPNNWNQNGADNALTYPNIYKNIQLSEGILNNDNYKNMIYLCLIRHWTSIVLRGLNVIQDQGYQFIVFAYECNRLAKLPNIKSLLKTKENGILASVMNKLAAFTDIHAMNFLKIMVKVFNFSYDDLNNLNLTFGLTNFNSASYDYRNWFKKEQGNMVVNDDTLKFDINGNCSFNINGLESEYYKMAPSLAQGISTQVNNNVTDDIALHLELLYKEFEHLEKFELSKYESDETHLYYPLSFSIVKSIWDHGHVTMANLLPELEKAFESKDTTLKINTRPSKIPKEFQAWTMMETKGRTNGDCYLCTKLRDHGVVTEEEFQIITTSVTPHAFKHHRKELMVYFEFAPEVLEQMEQENYDWKSLRPFADSMLKKVASDELESAYNEWMQTILGLKKESGQRIQDLKLLDVAIAQGVC
jgi:hypothetical protein